MAVRFLDENDKETLINKIKDTVKVSEITLLLNDWIDTGNGSLFKQIVESPDIAPNHKIDLMPTPEQMESILTDEISFTITNEGSSGQAVAYSIGGKPSSDYTFQVMLTEVNV